eukprot:TRINITY_DN9464_c0_g1_i1.p1 TRINITY_DN9464_c0_g1~~TRINITY_DN9464_c0_g1_i1.p1  ORF type:complete len:440 (+),score=81.09 TRINITY_DN9464_c0_g1_i1:492-1811(+)
MAASTEGGSGYTPAPENGAEESQPLIGAYGRPFTRKLSRMESSGQMRRTFSVIPANDAWRFKYHQFMANMPALDDALLGAGKREFYRRQKEMLEGFQEVDVILEKNKPAASTTSLLSGNNTPQLTKEEEEQLRRTEQREAMAVKLSNYVNIFLFLAKLYCCFFSSSLAVLASTLDSLLDLLAGFILWFTSYHMAKDQPDKYPVGKKRMQPVGIIVFAAIMATLGLQVLMEGVRRLVAGDPSEPPIGWNEALWLLGVLGGATVVKAFLFMYCRLFDNEIIQAYSQDHLFDVITNVVGLASALLCAWTAWWIDPVGAIAIALYTIVNWGKTVLENATSLVGLAAPPEFIGKLTYLVFNHHHLVKRICKIQAWTFGSLYWVEVDLQFDEDTSLRDAERVGKSLQVRLESLPEVERAFVQLCHDPLSVSKSVSSRLRSRTAAS